MLGVIASHLTPTDLVVLSAAAIAGTFAWRSKRGDFYKAVSEEKSAENDKLRDEVKSLRAMKDITPIVKALEGVTQALERTAAVQNETLEKVRDMNGSLRAHSAAMQALADKMILEESARGLLAAAAERKERIG